MKKWNAPEVLELSIASTAEGNTAQTNGKYKTKTQQCEYGHNTNFDFCGRCEGCGDETVTTDSLS